MTGPPSAGCVAELLQRRRRRCAGARRVLLFRQQRDGAVRPDGEHLVDAVEIGVFAVVLDERAVAADAGDDRLAGLRVQCRSRAAAKAASAPPPGRSSSAAQPFGMLARFGFSSPFSASAELDVGPEAAGAERHLQAGLRILAEHRPLRRSCGGCRGRLRRSSVKLARKAAFRIVGAADEGAVSAELQRQLSRLRRTGRRAGRRRRRAAGRGSRRESRSARRSPRSARSRCVCLDVGRRSRARNRAARPSRRARRRRCGRASPPGRP